MKAPDDPKLREILDRASELPPDQRKVFLDGACLGNAELRAEVESLLSSLEGANGFLGEATIRPSQMESTMEAPSRAPLVEGPGSRIGRYKLLQLIGEGGFGTVFMAEQEHPVRRRVALKIIKLGMDSKQVIARFEAERQALAMMDHPNIARVLDGGTTSTGRPYFVMDLVKGVPITEYCDQQNLSARERLDLFVPVCQAVQHAHQKGIIHRDIKPNNVLVTLADGRPVPKIIDFGIAKATNARLTEQTYFTEFRQFIGTPQYMSPEQAEMSAIDIDTRSDIYSLGVLLYELLTGTTPLDAKSLRSAAYDQVRQMIREVQPPRPSTRLSTLGETAGTVAKQRSTELHKLGQLLKGELDWVVMKALEKDRTRRYETANGLALDIERHLNNEQVLARPPSRVYAFQKFVSRHWVGAMAGSAVATALVIGLALASYGLVRARAETNRANAARIDEQTQRSIAEQEKQHAVANAQTAEANARNAEVRLSEGWIAQADALSQAGRYAEAHTLYTTAYDKLAELKQPLTSAELGLWSSYNQTIFPILNFDAGTKSVGAIAIAPDGRRAISGGDDNTLTMWDLTTGKALNTFRGPSQESRIFLGHRDRTNCVAITPDGRTVLSGGADNFLKVWDSISGQELRRLVGHKLPIMSVAISPDGQTALTGSFDTTLKLWDLNTGKVLHTLRGHTDPVFTVAIAPDGRTALSGSSNMSANDNGFHMRRNIKLWDLSNGNEIRSFMGHENGVSGVVFAPDGTTAISSGFEKTLKVWELATGKELRTFNARAAGVSGVAISTNGRIALSAGYDGIMECWDMATGSELAVLTGHTTPIGAVAISPDGHTAVSGGDEGVLKVWDLKSLISSNNIRADQKRIAGIAISPDGQTALTSGQDKTLKHWDIATGKRLQTLSGHTQSINSVTFLPDGSTALSASDDHTIKLWDLTSGKEIRAFLGHSQAVRSVAVSPDGRKAISTSDDSAVKLWDLVSGKCTLTITGETYPAYCAAFTTDGRFAISGGGENPATGSMDPTLKLWDLTNGKCVRTFAGHARAAMSIAVLPDGRSALSSSFDGTIKLWDLYAGTEIRTITSHSNALANFMALSRDGGLAISGGLDGKVRLWDVTGAKELRSLVGHNSCVWNVAISPDGHIAASGDIDGMVKIWDFPRGLVQRDFEPRVSLAQAKLWEHPNDSSALSVLGQWYAFREIDERAIELLIRARDGGAIVSAITLARCYWRSGALGHARREFQVALNQSSDPREQTYLGWCIAAVDSERRQQQSNREVGNAP